MHTVTVKKVHEMGCLARRIITIRKEIRQLQKNRHRPNAYVGFTLALSSTDSCDMHFDFPKVVALAALCAARDSLGAILKADGVVIEEED